MIAQHVMLFSDGEVTSKWGQNGVSKKAAAAAPNAGQVRVFVSLIVLLKVRPSIKEEWVKAKNAPNLFLEPKINQTMKQISF